MKNLYFLFLLLGISAPAFAQKADSVRPRKPLLGRLYREALQSMRRGQVDSGEFWHPVQQIAEETFKPYEGKIVRNITLIKLDFDHQLFDTATRVGGIVSRAATRFHATTKDWVLRNHLFVKEGQPLSAYQVADNERFLRTLSFIQDVRILPAPVGTGSSLSDSVDLVVVSKDVFSLGGDIPSASIQGIGLRGYDANFLGMGQRLQGTIVYDKTRSPQTGFDLSISRSSLGGSFINGGVGFSSINTGTSLGYEDESAGYLRLSLPLISPDARYAGGLELSINGSKNDFRKPESLFYNYRYGIADVWGGINFEPGREAYRANKERRQRAFLALRYLQYAFTQLPTQVSAKEADPVYSNQQAVLASITLFRLNFYRTSYLYGFGLTEDLPKGHKLTATAGWYRWNSESRPYLGFDFLRYGATATGKYLLTYARTGAFLTHDGLVRDAGVLLGATAYSRVYEAGLNKFREKLSGSFTLLYNPTLSLPLRIDNTFGLPGYGTDSVGGNARVNLWSESIVFLHRKIAGFRLAPFVSAGAVIISPGDRLWYKSNVFTGIGAGLRARNENLIFGTIEARFTWFPKTAYGIPPFYLNLATNLRFRYQSAFVRAPQVFQWNEEIL